MDKKKKLRKIALWLFIVSIICFMAFGFLPSVLKEWPVILNLVYTLLLIGLVGGFLGTVIILFISLIIREKQPESKAIKSPFQKDIANDRFNIKDGEQISDDSKKAEHAFCSLIKQEKKYKSIEDALEILQKDNYVLQNIRTSGEFSSHDWVAPFSHEYSSVDELKRCANDDFDKEKRCTSVEIDWSTTIFTVRNKDTGFNISFYYGEYNDFSSFSTRITKETKAYWDNVVKKLSSLIEEKNQ